MPRWVGRAQAIAGVRTFTVVAGVVAGKYFSHTINAKTITVLAADNNTTNVALLIKTALAASTYPEFKQLTFTVAANVVTVTGPLGVPFNVTTATDSAGGYTNAEPMAATGPNHLGAADNWDPALPVAADAVYWNNSNVSVLYDLDALSPGTLGGNLGLVDIDRSYTGDMGLPEINPGGYREYRNRFVRLIADRNRYGGGEGTGSGQLFLTVANSTQGSVVVYSTGAAKNPTLGALVISGQGGSITDLTVLGGNVTVAPYGLDSIDIATLTVVDGNATVGRPDSAAMVAIFIQSGGTATLYGCVTTSIAQSGGAARMIANGVIGTSITIAQTGGLLVFDTDNTVTTAGMAGTLDLSRDTMTRTFTTLTMNDGFNLNDPLFKLSVTNLVRGTNANRLQASS